MPAPSHDEVEALRLLEVEIPASTYEKLIGLASSSGETFSGVVADAIECYWQRVVELGSVNGWTELRDDRRAE